MKNHLRILEQEADKLRQDSAVNAVLLTGPVAYGEYFIKFYLYKKYH